MTLRMDKNIPWQLIISHLKGEKDEEAEKLFHEWLQGEGNARLFGELETLWKEIREEASSYNPDTSYYWKQLEVRINGKEKKRRVVSLWKFRAAVAAASVLLVISLTFSFLYGTGRLGGSSPLLSYSALNGKSRLLLPDSSVVWLNSGSTLEYEADFSRRREVSLNGEALFDVTKDEEHPFIVSTSGMKVKVHGTRFDVSAYSREENIKVTLFRGSVSVATDREEALLHPGEVALLNKRSKALDIQPADMFFESFWASESVRFEDKSLRYVSRYLEKWYNVKIELDPSIPDTQAYTFTMNDESLEVILRIMSRINPIAYSFGDDNNVKITNVELFKR